ncbi:hypothetical protein GQ602_002858 [Ophiocordyceps camponoti-floridani]|uniref:EthD domain-containing protein n=1 Tax=Ophiocordyceps camponoti-floridani TaxID=2030778 RepID=A0A8H4VG12_9HYPO|nr:hypothetical protein GQ602_002858 [Ophiocordyceps camponoti-floridani]
MKVSTASALVFLATGVMARLCKPDLYYCGRVLMKYIGDENIERIQSAYYTKHGEVRPPSFFEEHLFLCIDDQHPSWKKGQEGLLRYS